MKQFWPGILTLVALLVLTGCSSKPSDEAIRDQVTSRLQQPYGGTVFEVINIRKVNGIPRGSNNYIAEVEYDLHFKVGLDEAGTALKQVSDNIFAAGMKAAALGVTYGDFKAGDTQHKKERIPFVRTEKGWLIDEEAEKN